MIGGGRDTFSSDDNAVKTVGEVQSGKGAAWRNTWSNSAKMVGG
jgi:hypothetical protein